MLDAQSSDGATLSLYTLELNVKDVSRIRKEFEHLNHRNSEARAKQNDQ